MEDALTQLATRLGISVEALSEAFFEIYRTQKRPDFWGMREFYSTVRVINADLKVRSAQGLEAALEPQVSRHAILTNS